MKISYWNYCFSLTKLMVSHDLPRSMVTNQITFDGLDFHLTSEFELAMDRRCQALVFKLETLYTYCNNTSLSGKTNQLTCLRHHSKTKYGGQHFRLRK